MLEFVDCPHCGKRIRSDATQCHRCRQLLPQRNTRRSNYDAQIDDSGSPEHAAHYGGYDTSQDDFDKEEFDEEEFRQTKKTKNLWYYVAWILIVAMCLPILFQALQLLKGG